MTPRQNCHWPIWSVPYRFCSSTNTVTSVCPWLLASGRIAPGFREAIFLYGFRVPIMIGQGLTALQQTGSTRGIFAAAANLLAEAECNALVLDRGGRILDCGEAAQNIFKASPVQLMGRCISDFIAGLSLGGSSPSYSARYLGYLCANGDWRKFDARDVGGQRFAVELSLSRMVSEGREVFALDVRRPGEGAGS